MLDIRSQTQLADATADMMRACALATARAASTSMLQSITLWKLMLRSSAAGSGPIFPAARATQLHLSWTGLDSCPASIRPYQPETDAQQEEALRKSPPGTPADAGFSSYRSSSGHAVAQVIVPDAT